MGVLRLGSSSRFDKDNRSGEEIVNNIRKMVDGSKATNPIRKATDPPPEKEKRLPNPDPANWSIRRFLSVGGYLVVDVNYPDCTNYEGNKIMVYEGITYKKLSAQKYLDPH